MTTPLLEIRNLSRSFGGIRAVDALSFDVAPDAITGLIGPNGAGKTTVFNLITGACRPSSGTIRLLGDGVTDLTRLRPDRIVRAGVARTFQNIRLFGRMTCLENVMVPLLAHGEEKTRGVGGTLRAFLRTASARAAEERARETALAIMGGMGIADRAARPAATLPYGLQRRLEIARALACRPKLLLLDEPAAGMNDAETRELALIVAKARKDFGVAVLLIEHHIDLVMDICSRIVVMERGTLLAEGTPQSVRGDERVVAAYLGRPRERGKRI